MNDYTLSLQKKNEHQKDFPFLKNLLTEKAICH